VPVPVGLGGVVGLWGVPGPAEPEEQAAGSVEPEGQAGSVELEEQAGSVEPEGQAGSVEPEGQAGLVGPESVVDPESVVEGTEEHVGPVAQVQPEVLVQQPVPEQPVPQGQPQEEQGEHENDPKLVFRRMSYQRIRNDDDRIRELHNVEACAIQDCNTCSLIKYRKMSLEKYEDHLDRNSDINDMMLVRTLGPIQFMH